MKINEMKLSNSMIKLYKEVEYLLIPNKLYISISEQMDSEIEYLLGGAYAQCLPNGDFKISYTKNEPYLEYTLSHELLHIYLDVKGFPNVFLYELDGITENTKLVHDIGGLLKNLILHKIIIKEQLERGFQIEEARKDRLEGIVLGYQIQENLFETLRLTSFMLEAKDYIKEYQSQIANRYPVIYKQAAHFYEIIQNMSYQTPFETRKALVKLFKNFDVFLLNNSMKPLELNKKILINFIPSKCQLSLNVKQVFDIFTDTEIYSEQKICKYLFLCSKTEGQLSFIYNLNEEKAELEKQKINNMTVGDLFKDSGAKCIFRE